MAPCNAMVLAIQPPRPTTLEVPLAWLGWDVFGIGFGGGVGGTGGGGGSEVMGAAAGCCWDVGWVGVWDVLAGGWPWG